MTSLKNAKPIDTLIHLGSGLCSEISAYQQLNPARILLVEGDEEISQIISEEFASDSKVSVLNQWVDCQSGTRPAYRFNLSDANSLAAPTDLYQHFPGIKLVETLQVNSIAVKDYLAKLDLQGSHNALVLDLPGNSFDVLQQLQVDGLLPYFNQLTIYLNQHPLYDKEAPVDDVLAWLADHGFELSHVNSDQDIDRPSYLFNLNPYFIQIKELAEQNNQLISSKAELEKTHNEKLSTATQSVESKQATIAQLQAELAESNQSSKAKTEKLQQLEKQIIESQQLAKAKQEKVTALESQLAETQKSSATNNDTINKLKAGLNAETKNKQSISDKAKSLQAQLVEAQESALVTKEALNKLKADFEVQAKEKTSLSDKLNQLKKEKETLEKSQAELETTFNEKLSAATQLAESKQAAITQLQKELTEIKKSAQEKTEILQQLEKQLTETQQSAKAKQEKVTALESQLAEAQQSAKAKQEAFTALEAKHAALEEEKTKIHTYFVNRKKQAEEGEEKIKALTEANASLEHAKKAIQAEKETVSKDFETTKASLNTTQQALTQAQATIDALQNNISQLQKLEEKMSALFSKQGQTMQEYTNALGQHVTRTAKSTTQNIESFLGVQKYLVQDSTPLQLNGSRISADLALKLTERLHNIHYDLIIEFGAGTSTQLIAKALLKQEHDKPHSQYLISRGSDDAYAADLPKRIISFEHDKKAIVLLAEQLEQQGLASLVELIFAPLSDYIHKGEDYLFYGCKSKLKQLAQVLDQREVKVLVLVDGPDTPDESLSRYPLLPLLLKHLATHQLDIIVTQSHKHLTDELMANWQSLLNKRCLVFNTQHLTHEKDATLLQINGE